jgi:hypothetical protein
MMRLIGFICGTVIVAALSVWLFNTKLTPSEQQSVQQEIQRDIDKIATTTLDIVESRAAKLGPEKLTVVDVTPVAPEPTPEAEPELIVTIAKEDHSIPVTPEPEPEPELIPEIVVASDQQIASIWAPFRTHDQAQGFAKYLSEKSGEPLQVVERDLNYYITIAYHSQDALEQSFSNIKQYASSAIIKPLPATE